MSHRASRPKSKRHRLALILLATTAAAALLGGCSSTDRLFSKLGAPSSSEEVELSATEAAGAVAQWGALVSRTRKIRVWPSAMRRR